jgi:hypothetical protein
MLINKALKYIKLSKLQGKDPDLQYFWEPGCGFAFKFKFKSVRGSKCSHGGVEAQNGVPYWRGCKPLVTDSRHFNEEQYQNPDRIKVKS